MKLWSITIHDTEKQKEGPNEKSPHRPPTIDQMTSADMVPLKKFTGFVLYGFVRWCYLDTLTFYGQSNANVPF